MADTDDVLEDVLKALKTAWDANSATLSGLNGPYRYQKPADPTVGFPYVTVEHLPSAQDRWTCDTEYWFSYVTFWVHNDTPEKTNANVNTMRSIFTKEDLTLTLANGTVLWHRVKQSLQEQQDEHVYRGGMPLTIYSSRPRTKS